MNRYSMQIIGGAHCPEIDHWVDKNGEWVKFAELQAWQPIETAPKDGTAVLLWVPRCPGWLPRQYLGSWNPNVGAKIGGKRQGLWQLTRDDFLASESISHWRPLPEPPQ